MRRYYVRAEFEGNRIRAVGFGSLDADELDRLGLQNAEVPIDVRLERVVERIGDPEDFEHGYGFRFEPGEEVPMFPAELDVLYEYWEPGPGEQRLLEATWEGRGDA